jgi:hypothetical protein
MGAALGSPLGIVRDVSGVTATVGVGADTSELAQQPGRGSPGRVIARCSLSESPRPQSTIRSGTDIWAPGARPCSTDRRGASTSVTARSRNSSSLADLRMVCRLIKRTRS